ncbi:GtrA family protein [Thiorhodococcus minor]|uniref:GtrA family protein n=1 Tax=Thiorhodococcus minor TaxID=57489 RepID=A0A6M0K3R7_9GAMM|nr:GtrA family protein [Thiorhodococcus minor]NEV63257.1 GtrA family protein [Thiorhodococcus minor]
MSSLISRRLPKELVLFIVFSGSAAIANLTTGYVLYSVLGLSQGWHYALSVALAFLVGMGVSFSLNRRYTFRRAGRRLHDELRTFLIVSLVGLVLTVAVSSELRDSLLPALLARLPSGASLGQINIEVLAHVGAVGIVAGYSFLAHKFLSFGHGIRQALLRWARRPS